MCVSIKTEGEFVVTRVSKKKFKILKEKTKKDQKKKVKLN